MAVHFLRIFATRPFQQRRYDVDELRGEWRSSFLVRSPPAKESIDRRGDAPMHPMFIQAERRIGQIRPCDPVALVRVFRSGHQVGAIAEQNRRSIK